MFNHMIKGYQLEKNKGEDNFPKALAFCLEAPLFACICRCKLPFTLAGYISPYGYISSTWTTKSTHRNHSPYGYLSPNGYVSLYATFHPIGLQRFHLSYAVGSRHNMKLHGIYKSQPHPTMRHSSFRVFRPTSCLVCTAHSALRVNLCHIYTYRKVSCQAKGNRNCAICTFNHLKPSYED